MWSFNKTFGTCLILVFMLTGCGYTFSGSAPIDLPKGKTRLCITKFVNPSTASWLEPALRAQLRDEFTNRGQVEWVNANAAETLVTIKVISYSSSSTLKASDDETVKSAIQLAVEVEMYSAADHMLIWSSGTVRANSSYRGDSTKTAAQSEAVELAAEGIADRLGQAF